MRRKKGDSGSAITLFVVLLPVLLVVIGLVVDGAILTHQKLMLQNAVDTAARAATDSYDRTLWNSQGRVELDAAEAYDLAWQYMAKNMPEATLIEAWVDPLTPNQLRVRATVTVEFVFVKLAGLRETTVESWAVASKF